MSTEIEKETTTTEEESKPTLPQLSPMDQRKVELRDVLKQYSPENNVYFSGSTAIPQTVSEEAKAFLEKGQGVIVEDGDVFVARYDDVDIMTIDFFYALAATIGRRFVINAICGPQAAAFMPREGFPSCLADRAATYQLAFYYAARHGYFYKNFNHDVYTHAYSSIFSSVFHQEDDIFRIRLNRYSIYEDLVMWDYRAKFDIDIVYNNVSQSNDPNVREKLSYMEKVKENVYTYPFQGENRLGSFFPGLGYFLPGQKLPVYRTVVVSLYNKEEDVHRTDERMNLDVHLRLTLDQFLRYLCDKGIEDPDMTRFKFISVNKDEGTLILSNSIKEATDEEVKTEIVLLKATMGLPIPDTFPVIVSRIGSQEEMEEVKEEENDNADS